ncbi:hypothetical protein HDV01_006698 [Terramyces sp. JEL0728]|nr:hypothetical protein HDV01_006698 [Terramyces sp. JEL0728]
MEIMLYLIISTAYGQNMVQYQACTSQLTSCISTANPQTPSQAVATCTSCINTFIQCAVGSGVITQSAGSCISTAVAPDCAGGSGIAGMQSAIFTCMSGSGGNTGISVSGGSTTGISAGMQAIGYSSSGTAFYQVPDGTLPTFMCGKNSDSCDCSLPSYSSGEQFNSYHNDLAIQMSKNYDPQVASLDNSMTGQTYSSAADAYSAVSSAMGQSAASASLTFLPESAQSYVGLGLSVVHTFASSNKALASVIFAGIVGAEAPVIACAAVGYGVYSAYQAISSAPSIVDNAFSDISDPIALIVEGPEPDVPSSYVQEQQESIDNQNDDSYKKRTTSSYYIKILYPLNDCGAVSASYVAMGGSPAHAPSSSGSACCSDKRITCDSSNYVTGM